MNEEIITHWNGSRPFKVKIVGEEQNNKIVELYKQDQEIDGYTLFKRLENVDSIFVGDRVSVLIQLYDDKLANDEGLR